MTPAQFQSALDRVKLTQTGKRGADRFFKVGERTSRRWASGEYPIPRAVDYCLRMMIEKGVTPGELNKDFRE